MSVEADAASLLLLLEVLLFAAPAPACACAFVDGPWPADDEEALEAALPLRLCAFEKLRELG